MTAPRFARFATVTKKPTTNKKEKREMNKEEKQQRLQNAKHQLDAWADMVKGKHLLLISQRNGTGLTSYLKAVLLWTNEHGTIERTELQWALAVVYEYRLKDLDGEWHLAMSGYGYDKRYEIVRLLENYYGIAGMNYGRV